jgi:hypothetical protein
MSGIRDPGLRRFLRREYLRNHAQARRAAAKSEGARRIDVTLHGEALDNYETVRQYLKGIERLGAERIKSWRPRRRPISDTEVIRMALDRAAAAMREDDEKAAKQGLVQILAD